MSSPGAGSVGTLVSVGRWGDGEMGSGATRGEFNSPSDAARSWGGSAVLGVPPETKPDYVEPLWLIGYAEKG
ncbi:hypothetical protein BJP34_11850 [Moorena producens PAL-8-15-08-1]|uniref:Uncharacterized protein n=1 Tax=Moorena producens PAL-8-15-08-1 TaxID=1458985 RepID=A0A1D8TQY1_9CYAN|nr:hypothetical protein BJP34_11850 [Moorena producens PAL-8-15-08-1]